MSQQSFFRDSPIYKPGEQLLFLREEQIRFMQDMFFFVWCENHNMIKPILEKHHLGHAHHRLLKFIKHHPDLTVGELRNLLGITKQSLARVMKDVIRYRYVQYKQSKTDRRKRELCLTAEGERLEDELFQLQRKQFVRAFRETGDQQSVEGFQRVLHAMLSQEAKSLLENRSSSKPNKG